MGRRLLGLREKDDVRADVRGALNEALEMLPPRGRVALLHDLLTKATYALVEDEVRRLVTLREVNPSNQLPEAPTARPSTRIIELVTQRPGMSAREIARELDLMHVSCAATLTALQSAGKLNRRGQGWYFCHPDAGLWRCAKCDRKWRPAKPRPSRCPSCKEPDDIFPADDGGWERAEAERTAKLNRAGDIMSEIDDDAL